MKVLSISGGVWSCLPITERPQIVLSGWEVFELTRPGKARARHLVGYNETDGEGRVSSHIVTFDPEQARGVTNSGRVYQLVGRTGMNLDAQYTWRQWLDINQATDVVNVTAEVRAQVEAARETRRRAE